MTQDLPPIAVHPTGEQSTVALGGAAAAPQPLVVDSFAGSVRVEWDHATAFTPLGQLPFFIDFLKTAGLFDSFVADSPLNYESPNASKTRDVLGTAMLSMLAGHKRYSHIAALRGDGVLPELLGMRKIVSEDSVRRAFAAIEEEAGAAWMRRHLGHCLEPLLSEPWILDIDTTVKPLYGRQEGAVVGYNPQKPGRPSHCYHTYSMAHDWSSTWMCARGMSTRPITPHRLCGRCWIGQRVIVGRLCCAATRDSATRRSCAKPSSARWRICSSCG